ncbi:MAG: flavodoxin-dependent (E)-4-hydroxy-3-methylbut-2-enyl-diphosphate synthase, partial [Myxococcota bacterium]|nr:flavodoxin-dependent (E)-4-hydroxy-3-methylbut-2-enyl-diphosphate synthase [Myxococcota bacterium]
HVEKVRINPGNFADKKKFEVREYSDSEYAEEIERVADRFRPLVQRCKQNGVAMRIGTNHGSLSDRIMNRYGDSPLGMVESALEFLDICEFEDYRDVVFSMKASNTHVAIQAYRLLAARLEERDPGQPSYPFHLGVTEAGDGEDGRIKSAIGIGALLHDGVGDTIRVSLTEDPVYEVPVAEEIVRSATSGLPQKFQEVGHESDFSLPFPADPYVHTRRPTQAASLKGLRIGGDEAVRVEVQYPGCTDAEKASSLTQGWAASLREIPELECESILIDLHDESEILFFPDLRQGFLEGGLDVPVSARLPASLLSGKVDWPAGAARCVVDLGPRDGFATLKEVVRNAQSSGTPLEWCFGGEPETLSSQLDQVLEASADYPPFAFSLEMQRSAHSTRLLVGLLRERGLEETCLVLRHGSSHGAPLAVDAAIALGSSLCDGFGDMVCLDGTVDSLSTLDLAYRVLQASRLRTTRTEYISCPSCGRTLFDLEQTTARIKQATAHLVGVKIAVMGCIVNGPGEMADADFGYVGSGPGVVTLYIGKQVVARNIPEDEATDRLTELIHDNGY